MKYCERQIPKDKSIKAFRSDSAAYQTEIINHCQSNDIEFAIGADLDEAVFRTGYKNTTFCGVQRDRCV